MEELWREQFIWKFPQSMELLWCKNSRLLLILTFPHWSLVNILVNNQSRSSRPQNPQMGGPYCPKGAPNCLKRPKVAQIKNEILLCESRRVFFLRSDSIFQFWNSSLSFPFKQRHKLRYDVIKNTQCVRVRVELEKGGRCRVGSDQFLIFKFKFINFEKIKLKFIIVLRTNLKF